MGSKRGAMPYIANLTTASENKWCGVHNSTHSFSLPWQVADSWEALDGWLDAIRLVYTIFARGKSDVLAGIITG
jgi:hypothetical protein